jgi:hypothetical protein
MITADLVALALSVIAALGWTIRRLRRERARLELRIEMLEHPERFPPVHPNCRSSAGPFFWGRDLSKHPMRARRPHP